MTFDEYKASLDEELRDVLLLIAALERDEDITPMERSVQTCELESRKCTIHAARAAIRGAVDDELAWTKQKDSWQQRLKVAVAARSQDLLPKILDRQNEDQDVVRELYAIK